MSVVRVQSRGQITIPEDVRAACGIEAGDELYISSPGAGVLECVLLPKRRSIVEVTERYSVAGPVPDLEVLREEMGDDLAREYDYKQETCEDDEACVDAGEHLTIG